MLKCPCGLAYVGKTSRTLKNRISEHRCAIRNHDQKSPVANHFNSFNHPVASFSYISTDVTETCPAPMQRGDINNLFSKRELFWIFTLNTLTPKGLNKEMDIHPFP